MVSISLFKKNKNCHKENKFSHRLLNLTLRNAQKCFILVQFECNLYVPSASVKKPGLVVDVSPLKNVDPARNSMFNGFHNAGICKTTYLKLRFTYSNLKNPVYIFLKSRGGEKSFWPDSCRRCEGEKMSLFAAWRDRKSLVENDIFKIVKI